MLIKFKRIFNATMDAKENASDTRISKKFIIQS